MKAPAFLLLVAGGLLSSACTERHEHVRTVEEFMEQPAVLDGVVLRCNARVDHAKHDRECINAWAAVERLGQADDASRAPKLQQQFERSRERARTEIEQRAAATREAPYDPYRAPVIGDSQTTTAHP